MNDLTPSSERIYFTICKVSKSECIVFDNCSNSLTSFNFVLILWFNSFISKFVSFLCNSRNSFLFFLRSLVRLIIYVLVKLLLLWTVLTLEIYSVNLVSATRLVSFNLKTLFCCSSKLSISCSQLLISLLILSFSFVCESCRC